MGKAFKCDRCGRYFDCRAIPINRYIVIGTRLQSAYKKKQLCKKCFNELNEFLKSGDALWLANTAKTCAP
jgi:hypothetical protein